MHTDFFDYFLPSFSFVNQNRSFRSIARPALIYPAFFFSLLTFFPLRPVHRSPSPLLKRMTEVEALPPESGNCCCWWWCFSYCCCCCFSGCCCCCFFNCICCFFCSSPAFSPADAAVSAVVLVVVGRDVAVGHPSGEKGLTLFVLSSRLLSNH